MPYYPRFVDSAKQWLAEHPEAEQLSEEQILDADERFFEINQAFYDDRLLYENNLTTKSIEEIRFEHTIRLQEFFEDTFGEDAWDDRHEIYAEAEA